MPLRYSTHSPPRREKNLRRTLAPPGIPDGSPKAAAGQKTHSRNGCEYLKKARRVAILFVALVLVAGLWCQSYASAPTGSLTIELPHSGVEYYLYKVMTAESNGSDGIIYKTTDPWKDFVEDYELTGVKIFSVSPDGTVSFDSLDSVTMSYFAAAVQKHAVDNKIDPVATKKADGANITFENLPFGYYVVGTSLEATAIGMSVPNIDEQGVYTEDPSIVRKNELPRLNKELVEKGEGNLEAGTKLQYKITVTAAENADAHEYVIHDIMTNQVLYLNHASNPTNFKVYLVRNSGTTALTKFIVTDDPAAARTAVQDGGYEYALYTGACTSDPPLACAFEVFIGKKYDLHAGDEIIIDYATTVIGTGPITNDAVLTTFTGGIGGGETPPVYSYSVPVLKYTGEPTASLSGAKFVLSRLEGGVTKYATADYDSATGVYTVDGWTENPDAAAVFSSGDEEFGDPIRSFTISGLAAGSYTLTETEAPEGYNKLGKALSITIEETTTEKNGEDWVSSATITTKLGDGTQQATGLNDGDSDGILDNTTSHVVNIRNNAGSELPSTGGVGTTIFYIVGGVLVLAALVFLIARRRMK